VGYTSSGFVRELNDMRDLERVFSSYGLSIVGKPQVWVAFKFSSDDAYQYEGNYIDNFALYKAGGAAPFGTFDTPAHGSTGVTGNIAVTGWALDDDQVTKVEIWRNSVSPEPAGQVYIGDANFVPGARPDVDAAYSTYPWSFRAGWGYMMLTNFLPSSGNGTFVIHAYAKDAGGGSTLLGSKTITCSNATATKPFGTIDTPGQGETVSGVVANFGWALTPQTATIPVDGSTIWVYVDGVPLGHPTYNLYRDDIATLFPGYNNSGGAVGLFSLDTTTLTNGLHSLAWSVTDNQGRTDGIGSRFIWVQN
nr:Ig-like domain-containing protein [Chloroflexota bacterium]